MHEKSPAFQFYPKDFLNDEKQLRMSLAEAGAYIRLLSHCWNEGSLPPDQQLLARMCGATVRQMKEMWPALANCFKPTLDGRLIHPRLEREREKQATYRQRQSDKGKASAAARASTTVEPRLNHGYSPVDHPVEPRLVEPARKLNSSSSSAVSDLQFSSNSLPENLDELWLTFQNAYPGKRREGGRITFDFFAAACGSVGFDVLMAALLRHKQTDEWKRGFAPGMQKWFEKTMWIQTPDTESGAGDVAAMQAHLDKIDADKAARGR